MSASTSTSPISTNVRVSFGHLGNFHCRYFDAAAAEEFAGADIVMMNGVLHHIADEELTEPLANVRSVLRPDAYCLRSTVAIVRVNRGLPNG